MKTYLRALVTLAVMFLTTGPVWAHHISGLIYCDENRSGVIDLGDRPLDGVVVKITSLTADPGATLVDTSGDTIPFSPAVPGFYYVGLPSRSDDYKDELMSGLPGGSTVIFPPPGGVYLSLPIITCSGCPTNKKEDVNFLVDGCQLHRCGDGVTDPGLGEECDQGVNNSDSTPDACRTDCTLPACGDGVIDPGLGEQCEPPSSLG